MSSFTAGESPTKAKINQKFIAVQTTEPAQTGDDADVRVWLNGKALKIRESATGKFFNVEDT